MENQGERKGIKVEITIVEREKAEMCKKGKEVQNGVENWGTEREEVGEEKLNWGRKERAWESRVAEGKKGRVGKVDVGVKRRGGKAGVREEKTRKKWRVFRKCAQSYKRRQLVISRRWKGLSA